MAVRVGHASNDERMQLKGGVAGEQNGSQEVFIKDWYNKGWQFVLRCTDANIAEKMAITMEKACANSNIGYDQYQRNSLYIQAQAVGMDLAKVSVPCECDCSSLICICAIAAGLDPNYFYVSGNMKTTSTMKAAFVKTGKFQVLTEAKYLTSADYVKRGDILVIPGNHTVMVLDNGPKSITPAPAPAPAPVIPNTSYCGKGIGTAVAKQYMTIRGAANKNGASYGTIPTGTAVEVLEILTNGWYKIVWPGVAEGFAYTSNVGGVYYSYTAKFQPYKVRVTAASLRVRKGPSTAYATTAYLARGTEVTIVEVSSNNWGRLEDGCGWTSLTYTEKV